MRNIALIVLDSVRKDVFDEYAPRLRAASDVSFEQCRAASSWSAPSHWSMFTGRLPHQHGVHAERIDATFNFGDLDRGETILGRLPDHHLVGVSANPYMNEAFGFDAHFDEFHDFSSGTATTENLFTEALSLQQYLREADGTSQRDRYLGFVRACLAHDKPMRSLGNGAWWWVGPTLRRLPIPDLVDDGTQNVAETFVERAAAVDEPWFSFVNVMDAHTPLRNLYRFDQSLHSVPNRWSSNELTKWELNMEGKVTGEYARNYRQLYAAAVDYLDRTISECMGRVQRATDRETTFVIVSDHGHNLGYPADKGLFHHTRSMTEAVLHTPCEIVNPPPGYPASIDGYFSQVDLRALMADLAAGEPFDATLVSDRVAAELVGLFGDSDSVWRSEFDGDEAFWNRMIRCVYDDRGPWKWQWDLLDERVKYRIDPDRPSWQREVEADVGIPPEARAPFDVDIHEFKQRAAEISQDLAFDGDVEERLEDLGYL